MYSPGEPTAESCISVFSNFTQSYYPCCTVYAACHCAWYVYKIISLNQSSIKCESSQPM